MKKRNQSLNLPKSKELTKLELQKIMGGATTTEYAILIGLLKK